MSNELIAILNTILVRIQPNVVANAGWLGVKATIPGRIVLARDEVGDCGLAKRGSGRGLDIGIGCIPSLILRADGIACGR